MNDHSDNYRVRVRRTNDLQFPFDRLAVAQFFFACVWKNDRALCQAGAATHRVPLTVYAGPMRNRKEVDPIILSVL